MAKSLPSYDSELPNEYNLSYCLLSSQLLFIYLLTLDTYYINILIIVKGTLHFLEMGSLYYSPRVKCLTVFLSIQPISGSGCNVSTFSLA